MTKTDENGNKTISSTNQAILDSIDPDFVQWMCPPGGFRANIHFIDFIQPGTLKLKFGSYFSIPNLVCENATFNFSKQMVKDPAAYYNYKSTGEENKFDDIISPLYCDVTLQFRPCTKFSDKTLKQYIMGAGNKNTLDRVNFNMRQKLEKNDRYQPLTKA